MKHPHAIILAALLLTGCGDPFLNLGTVIEGEITPKDEHGSVNDYGYMFYNDGYQFMGKAGAQFKVEIETLEGDPVHFQLNELDIDLWCKNGTNSATFITPDTRSYSCCVYLRSDYVDSGGSSYRLTITPL